MRIAYVTTYDSADIHAWSGLGAYILTALQSAGFQTEAVGNLRGANAFRFKLKEALYTKLLFQTYDRDREPSLLKKYARQVESALGLMSSDIVFSPGTIPIAYLQTEKPVVFWTDATFAGAMEVYPWLSNLCAETIRHGNKMEGLALSKCQLAIYSSDWAANTAIRNYNVDAKRVKVVPFGANVRSSRNLKDIKGIVSKKDFGVCKLLFIGTDWFRKGGDVALAVAELLNGRGIRTELHVVGCSLPIRMPSFVRSHGFISKTTEDARAFLDELFVESHFLIVPSRGDCVPVVFAEASSFGLPSLGTKVGGVSTAIQDGRNGQMFVMNEKPEKYSDWIERFMLSPQEYSDLALSSFRVYSERLNWVSAGRKVHDLIHEFCG